MTSTPVRPAKARIVILILPNIFPPGGGIESVVASGVEVSSPVFEAAAKACGGP